MIDLLSEATLRKLLNIDQRKLITRETERKLDDRVVEFVTIENHKPQRIVIKYGTEECIFNKEILYYQLLKIDEVRAPETYVIRQCENGLFFLAIEMLEGEHPEFDNEIHVEKVYKELGKWAVAYYENINDPHMLEQWRSNPMWQKIESEHNSLYKSLINLFTRIPMMIRSFVTEHQLAHNDVDLKLLSRLPLMARELIDSIWQLPVTLDHGDTTVDNIILCRDGKVGFIDFQGISLRPTSIMFCSMGEPWNWIPNGRFVEQAMRAFLHVWNNSSHQTISWETFYISYSAARIYFKCSLLDEWFTSTEMDNHLIQYANGYVTGLLGLLKEM